MTIGNLSLEDLSEHICRYLFFITFPHHPTSKDQSGLEQIKTTLAVEYITMQKNKKKTKPSNKEESNTFFFKG